MKLFNIDSPLMQGLTKMADLLWLNLLCIVCSIPIFTLGASVTALHYVCLKIVRDEEIYITKSFFKSFKENFKQSTIIWLIFLFIGILLGMDYYLMLNSTIEFPKFIKILILAATVLVLFTYMFVFPLQAKFSNPILGTIRNSFLVGVMQAPKTIVMMLMLVVPVVLCYYVEKAIPLVLMFGVSIQAFVSALMYNKFFKKLEDRTEEEHPKEDLGAEDEHIFSDELDPALQDKSENNQ